MLVLWKFYDVVREFPQLQVGEAVVAEVFQQTRAAGRGLVSHQRAHAHTTHANANSSHAHAAADQLCKYTTNT